MDKAKSTSPEKIVIRVIDAHRSLLDISIASIEEITDILEKSTDAIPDLGKHRQSILGISNIAELLQGPLRSFIVEHSSITEIVARELLSSGVFTPIIVRSQDKNSQNFRLRPSKRINAVYPDGSPASAAAEEYVDLVGISRLHTSSTQFAHFMCNVFTMPWIGRNLIKSGSAGYPGPVVASLHPIPPLSELGDQIMFADREDAGRVLTDLMRQMSIAVNYVMGPGVGVGLSSSKDNAKVLSPGADASIISAITDVADTTFGKSPQKDSSQNDSSQKESEKKKENSKESLQYLLWRLSKIRNDVPADDPNSWVFDLSPLYDLFRTRAFDAYLQIITHGRDSAETFLMEEAARQLQIQFADTQAKNTFKQMAMAAQYIQIIEDKLGASRANDMPRFTNGGSPERILASLQPKERVVVKTEYENRVQMWKSRTGNKCPHVKIESRMRSAATMADTARQLQALLAFGQVSSKSTQKKSLDWIYCRNCNFRLICPHVRDKIILEAKKSTYDEIRTRLLKYVTTGRTSSETNSLEYFCRICGEQIADSSEDDTAEIMGRFGNLDESLRTVIWAEAVNAVADVHFQIPVDPRQFASASVDMLYNVILSIEKPLKASQRSRAKQTTVSSVEGQDDEILPIARLNVILAVYAYILNLIQSPKSNMRFENVRPGAKIDATIDAMMTRIVERHGGLITRMEEISQEFIMGRFQELFRAIKGLGADIHLRAVDAEEELWRQLVQIDPVYHYAARMARIANVLPVTADVSRPEIARKEFETVMGASLPQLVKNARANAKKPEFAQLYGKTLIVQIPPGTTLEYMYKNPEVNLFAKMFHPKIDERLASPFLDLSKDLSQDLSHEITGGKVTAFKKGLQKSNKESVLWRPLRSASTSVFDYGLVAISYDLLVQYETTILNRESEEKYLSRLKTVLRAERRYLQIRRELATHPRIPFDFGAIRFRPQPVHIGMLFDENGFHHDWSIFIMSTGKTEKMLELRQKSVLKAILSGELTDAKLVDVKCSVCGITQTQAESLDENKVRESLRLANQMDTFFQFYESRCPEGNLHVWPDNSSCQKCGLRSGLLSARRVEPSAALAAESRDYFSKYANKFDMDKQILSAALEKPEFSEELSESESSKQAVKDLSGWKYDYGIISKVADLVSAASGTQASGAQSSVTPALVTPELIESMGAMEGRTYADVLEGKNAPPPLASIGDARIFAIASIVRGFIMEYNRLRFIIKNPKPSQFLTNIVEKAGVPKHEYEQLSHSLPEIGTDFITKYRAIIDETEERGGPRTPLDVVNFGIEYLCRLVLQLLELPTFKVAHVFAVEALKMFLRQEKLL